MKGYRKTTPLVRDAFKEVQKFFPAVCLLLYLPDGRWQFLDQDGEAPTFPNTLDVSVLEAAADSILDTPALFYDETAFVREE